MHKRHSVYVTLSGQGHCQGFGLGDVARFHSPASASVCVIRRGRYDTRKFGGRLPAWFARLAHPLGCVLHLVRPARESGAGHPTNPGDLIPICLHDSREVV